MARVYRFNFKNLDVYQAAVDHFGWTARVVGELSRPPFAVTNQFLSAALSIVANIGEANGREKRPRETEQHYRYALGSTHECAAVLDALWAMDLIDERDYNEREENLARIASMLVRLMQREEKRGR
ncbi:MAG TPA: four helix bundle protein [Longimicrobiales bacterium]|nr:four helix bundle protein [Longimicrobiales bacterium]